VTRKECAAKYVSAINEQWTKFANKEINDITVFDLIDFTIPFCEQHKVLMDDFISCKFNPTAFYYLCRWIIGDINDGQFSKAIAALNTKESTAQPATRQAQNAGKQ
jgi:hypothetical protein